MTEYTDDHDRTLRVYKVRLVSPSGRTPEDFDVAVETWDDALAWAHAEIARNVEHKTPRTAVGAIVATEQYVRVSR